MQKELFQKTFCFIDCDLQLPVSVCKLHTFFSIAMLTQTSLSIVRYLRTFFFKAENQTQKLIHARQVMLSLLSLAFGIFILSLFFMTIHVKVVPLISSFFIWLRTFLHWPIIQNTICSLQLCVNIYLSNHVFIQVIDKWC